MEYVPRPKSDEKRSVILQETTRVIVMQGLSAPTMVIAKEAGVANGSLFTYFATKTDLFNQLYLELKMEMASGAMNFQYVDPLSLPYLSSLYLSVNIPSVTQRLSLAV
jgi:AcrR family transcriptional regulator